MRSIQYAAAFVGTRRLRLLDHPLSRMMTTVAVGPTLAPADHPLHDNLSSAAVANSAAHHMMNVIQML
jgi:hypothetical protein